MSQLRGLGPLPLMLKWIQIQNFVDVVTILESKWPEKVKQNFIWLYLASEWSKTLSEMGLFNEIALHVWFHFENSGAISNLISQNAFFLVIWI